MDAILPPLLLKPIYVTKPWGGRRLESDLGRVDLPEGPVGESWEVIDSGAHASVVDGGPHDGRSLRDVLGAPFPLILKVIDAREDLSVQVHPDGEDGAPAKEEAWIPLAPGCAVAMGSVAAQAAHGGPALPAPGGWLERLRHRRLAFHARDPHEPPAIVHVPPGTVHCILAGSLLFEIQNAADTTWRLDDHGRVGVDGRPRPLHTAEARAVLARGAPRAAPVTARGRRLTAERFSIHLGSPVGVSLAWARWQAAFFLEAGTVWWKDAAGSRQDLAVPAGRTVVLPGPSCSLASRGWFVLAGVHA